MISTLSGLTYKNIGKMANKTFNIPSHLKHFVSIHNPVKSKTCKSIVLVMFNFVKKLLWWYKSQITTNHWWYDSLFVLG